MDEPEITELEKIDADRVDGVGMPANGIGFLMLKQVAEPVAKGARDCPKCSKTYDADHTGSKCENCGTALPDATAAKAADEQVQCPTCKGDGKMRGDSTDCPDCGATGKVTPAKAKTLAAKALVKAIVGRKVDETPDIAGGTAVIGQIADLIIGEAQELKAGNTGEISDIFQLAAAAEMIWTWRTGEEAVSSGSVMPATALMQSAAKSEGWGPWTPADFAAFKAASDQATRDYVRREENFALGNVAKDRGYSAAERKEMAGDGRALPDGSYPIADEHDLNSAAILARSGHGDVDAATKHIGKRAKELGVPNPLDNDGGGDTAKGQIAPEGTDVDTGDTGSLSKAVEEAVAKATAPLEKLRRELEETLAKVKATPVPGGPVLSHNVQVKTPGGVQDSDKAAKAALYRAKAEVATSPADRDGYLALARETEKEARTQSA